jgi:hypothetical protein
MKWSESERDRAIRAYSENVMVVNRYREIAEVTALLVNRDIVQERIDQDFPCPRSRQSVSSGQTHTSEACLHC